MKASVSEELAKSGKSFAMSFAVSFVQIVNHSVVRQVLNLSVGIDHIGEAVGDIGCDPVYLSEGLASEVGQCRHKRVGICLGEQKHSPNCGTPSHRAYSGR